jgi:hypothetical protein
MAVSIILKMSRSYFDLYGKNIKKFDSMNDDYVCIKLVDSSREDNAMNAAMKQAINYLLDHEIGLLNYREVNQLIQQKILNSEWERTLYEISKNDHHDDEYRRHLHSLYDVTGDFMFICNRFSKGDFGQPNGWTIVTFHY